MRILHFINKVKLNSDANANAKSLQSCPTLCDPTDSSPPGSHPWDSPGKNTGVGCHFLLQCMKVKSEGEVTQSYPTLSNPHGLQPTRLLHPWGFPSKSTGVGCHCLNIPLSLTTSPLLTPLTLIHFDGEFPR